MKNWLPIMLFFISSSILFGIEDMKLHLKVVSLEKAAPPQFVYGKALFTAEAPEDTRHIGISFLHENFETIYSFKKNRNGVYFFLMDIPDVKTIKYRLIIDGIWQTDPLAPATQQSHGMPALSAVKIPADEMDRKNYPLVTGENEVEFVLRVEPGSTVYLAGTFNQWDPYMIKMVENEPGIFKKTVKLSRGSHKYSFFIDGSRTLDPGNPLSGRNIYGERVSIFYFN